jgi:hypothetical protein
MVSGSRWLMPLQIIYCANASLEVDGQTVKTIGRREINFSAVVRVLFHYKSRAATIVTTVTESIMSKLCSGLPCCTCFTRFHTILRSNYESRLPSIRIISKIKNTWMKLCTLILSFFLAFATSLSRATTFISALH